MFNLQIYSPFKLKALIIYRGSTLNFRILLIFTIFLISINCNAQRIITLSQSIKSGLSNRNSILANKIDLAVGSLQTEALFRKFRPQLSLEYSYLYNPILQTSILPIGVFNPSFPIDATKSVQFGTKWNQSAGIYAIQPIFDRSLSARVNESKLQERILALSFEQSENDLAYTIAQAYIAICIDNSKIESLKSDTSRTFIQFQNFKNIFDEERLLKTEVIKSEILHFETLQLLSNAISLLIEDKVYLLYLMGEKSIDSCDFQVDSNVSAIKFDDLLLLDPKQLSYLNELDVKSQLTDLQAMLERYKQSPTVAFKGFLGANQFLNAFNPVESNSWFGSSYIGLDVKIPLMINENTRNKIKQMKLQSNQYQFQKDDLSQNYSKDRLIAKLMIDNFRTRLITLNKIINLSSESLSIFDARFLEGQESIFNVKIEELKHKVLKADYLNLEMQLWTYWLNYLNASGHLSLLWQ